MTEPAVHVPVQRPGHGEHRRGRQVQGRGASSTGLRRAAAIAAAGVPVGLLWWVLAPSGLNILSGDPALRNGSNPDARLPRDLMLAGLFLLAGCIAGALAAGTKHQEPSSKDVVLAVAAGAFGALLAWGTGVLCGLWWGAPEDTSSNASIAFSLRSYAVLVIWPAAVALSIFLGRFSVAPKKPASGDPLA
ncbi:hypothetical protein QFZ79_004127 [Arthrobacter sp. V4I6]|uniref:hypothetical protein n=1 Tax=unclassified Arthrobacter TaxID=235627 RepID=UPI00278A3007|nr:MULTISPECIES: hypothetical protein [unclassified Arthrobacter]MDQ0821752.1 hypothetical protein [Arthrobacter sp. V1I7]MDQ0856016.1 hypothetical protein [Arthrobacter sp. V4I6]